MRKLLALSLVACLAVSTAVLFEGCAKKAAEEQPATEQQPAQMPAESTGTMAESTAAESLK